jgi:hypothetical protein
MGRFASGVRRKDAKERAKILRVVQLGQPSGKLHRFIRTLWATALNDAAGLTHSGDKIGLARA